MRALIILFTSAILLTGCDETKKVIDVAGNVQLAGNYTISAIGEKAVTENAPTISFMAYDKSIKGNTGCNSFFGKYALDLNVLTFSDIGSTEMACDQPIMDIENNFLQALRETGSFTLQNNVLTLLSKDDQSVLLKAQKETNE